MLKDLVFHSFVWKAKSDIYIEYNTFVNSEGFSLGDSEIDVFVRYNRFESRPDTQNAWTLEAWVQQRDGSPSTVSYNSFLNTGEVAVSLLSGHTLASIDASFNYWGTTDEAVIESMIWDKNDDLKAAGFINYAPYLESPDSRVP